MHRFRSTKFVAEYVDW